MRQIIYQQTVVRHVVFQIRVRPVGAEQHAVGELLHQAAGEGHDIGVGVLLAVQGFRPGEA